MIDIIKIIIALGLPTFIGYFILVKLNARQVFKTNILMIIIAHPIGMVIFTYTLFLLNILLQVPLTVITSSIILLILILISFLIFRFDSDTKNKEFIENVKTEYNFYFIGVILLLVLFYGYFSLQVPVIDLPEKSIWAGKAKMFFIDNGINIQRLFSSETLFIQGSYPLGYPLLLTWVSLCLGRFDPILLKIVPTFYCFICAMSLYCIFKQETRYKYLSEILIFLLITSKIFLFLSWKVYADIYLITLVVPAIYCFVKALEEPNKKLLILGCLLLGGSTFIKNEGILYFILISTIFMIFQFKSKSVNKKDYIYIITIVAIFAVIFIVPQKTFVILNERVLRDFSINGFSNHFNLKDTLMIADRFMDNLILRPLQFNCIWILGILFFVVNIKQIIKNKETLFLTSIICVLMFCFFIIFFFSTRNFSWHLIAVPRILLIPSILVLMLGLRKEMLVNELCEVRKLKK